MTTVKRTRPNGSSAKARYLEIASFRDGMSSLLKALHTPALFLWLAYLLAAPFYVYKSGQAQPADAAMALLFVAVFASSTKIRIMRDVPAARALGAFIAYVVGISLFWAVVSGYGWSIAVISTYYVYNYLAFIAGLWLYHRYGRIFLAVSIWGAALSAMLQASLAAVGLASAGTRATLFFNNPNQLGYFAVLTATIVALGAAFTRFPRSALAVCLAGCAYLAALSLSKAAIVAVLAFGLVGARRNWVSVAVAGFIVVAALTLTVGGQQIADSVFSRMSVLQEDDTFAARGYDRIWLYPQHLVFGAAEGGLRRWGNSALGGEIHSSFGTILFSYGIVGSLLFLRFLFRVFAGRLLQFSLLFAPVALYSITHMGLRFTEFWIALALMVCFKAELSKAGVWNRPSFGSRNAGTIRSPNRAWVAPVHP